MHTRIESALGEIKTVLATVDDRRLSTALQQLSFARSAADRGSRRQHIEKALEQLKSILKDDTTRSAGGAVSTGGPIPMQVK